MLFKVRIQGNICCKLSVFICRNSEDGVPANKGAAILNDSTSGSFQTLFLNLYLNLYFQCDIYFMDPVPTDNYPVLTVVNYYDYIKLNVSCQLQY